MPRNHAASPQDTAVTVPAPAAEPPFRADPASAEEFTRDHEAGLARAREAVRRLVAVAGPRTLENTLRPYDDALLEGDAVAAEAALMENVHPNSAVREAAERVTRAASSFLTGLLLDPDVYDALRSLDLAGADPPTRHYVGKTLREFRLAGADRDPPTRARIERLNDEIVRIGQEFARNIRADRRVVTVTSRSELDGLPPDYVARHEPDASGRITLAANHADSLPVFLYARSDALRQRMYLEFHNRAYPENAAVLRRLIAARHELATLLGYPHWAEYVTANKMAGRAATAAAFADRLLEVSAGPAARDYRRLLARKREDVPGADVVNAWEAAYYTEQVRRLDHGFDAREVRPYLPYERVKQGVLETASRMFSVSFRRTDAPAWHPSVECYEMTEADELVGRFYLDMHPRRDKYNHAAQFDVRVGVLGRRIPEAALICNFPGGRPGDPGLMEHRDVLTFFHEFGHLLHALFGARHRWAGIGGIRTEHDFVEVPSQLLEEWGRDPAVLAGFARHHETGESIPAELVRRMNRADEFGRGLHLRRQLVYARTSLACHDRPPSAVDPDAVVRRLTRDYLPIPFAEGTHFPCSFGHLNGYSALYYSYLWSLVIAKDLFAEFDRSNLLDPRVAARYREAVLDPGGSAPAAELVERFLGRPFAFDAFRRWLDDEP